MGEYTTKIRTNFFGVKDEKKFTKIISACMVEDEITIITETQENGTTKYGFICGGIIYGLPENYGTTESGQDFDDDEGCIEVFYRELQKILSEGEAIIITTVAFEKLRSLVGHCTIITGKEVKHIEIGAEAGRLAEKMLGSPDKVKILNLTIQDRSNFKNPKEFVVSFEVREDVDNSEEMLRKAVKEFLLSETDESKQAISYSNNCFNWGDVFSFVPDSFFIKHGLTPLNQAAIDIFVDHDEILTTDLSDDLKLLEVRNLIKTGIEEVKQQIAFWENAENPVAEGIAESLSERDKKLCSLMATVDINEQLVNELIKSEEDDDLIVIYEGILDILQS